MKKTFLLALIAVLLLVIAACTTQQQAQQEQTTQQEQQQEQPTEETSNVQQEETSQETVEAQQEVTQEETQQEVETNKQPSVKEFTLEANQWSFVPDTITVKKGDTVRLKITSTDVAHGIAIPEFGVNEYLPPNKEVTVEFVADKVGTFSFYCSVYCGAGHSGMRGKLVVEE